MQRQSIAAGLALCLATLPALAAGPNYLRGADCLDPSMARNWVDMGDHTILVDAGRKKYRMQISPACPDLSFSPHLRFKGEPVSGRVCGNLGDSVITRDSRCPINRMELIDAAQYKQALDQRKSKPRKKPVVDSKAP